MSLAWAFGLLGCVESPPECSLPLDAPDGSGTVDATPRWDTSRGVSIPTPAADLAISVMAWGSVEAPPAAQREAIGEACVRLELPEDDYYIDACADAADVGLDPENHSCCGATNAFVLVTPGSHEEIDIDIWCSESTGPWE